MKSSFVTRFVLGAMIMVVLGSGWQSSAVGQLIFSPGGVGGPHFWNTNLANTIWSNGGAVAWSNGGAALFSNGITNELTLSEEIQAISILQTGVGTSTSISGVGQVLRLNGSGVVVSNSGPGILTFESGLAVNLEPTDSSLSQEWWADDGAIITVDATLSGNAGTLGLLKTGLGRLVLNGNNSYSGLTVLGEGILEVGSATALGSSVLSFQGGTLRYGASISGGFAGQFADLSGDAAIIDTNGFNITLNEAIGGNGGLTKRGDGILTLAASNTFVGDIRVEQGVLKASNAYSTTDGSLNTPFGPKGSAGNKIYVSDGATLDLNGGYSSTSATGNNFGGGKYEITVVGHGVDGTGAIRNTGANMANFGPFSKVTFLGDTTLGVTSRWDLIQTEIVGDNPFDLIKVGGGQLAWGATSATNNLKNIHVKAGSIAPISGNNYGDVTASFIISSAASLSPWATQTLSKRVLLNPENSSTEAIISANGDGNSVTDYSIANLNGQLTLAGASLLTTGNGRRDLKINGQVTDAGRLRILGVINSQSQDTSTGEKRRVSIIYLTNSSNDFTGEVIIDRGILRMGDGTNSGKFGAGANKLTMNNADANFVAIFDLFGTTQTVGSLHSTASYNYIENDKAGSTATLKVGSDNSASASFAGTLRDNSEMLPYNLTYGATPGVGTTGILAFEKVGTGRQILTAINTFTGGTTVTSGQLQIGQGATGTSTARLGNGKFVVNGGSLMGNGIIGYAGLQSEVNAGGSLVIGTFDQTAAQVLSVEGSFKNEGVLSFDVFAYTNGSGSSSNSDVLKFLNDEMQMIGGTLELVDRTSSSLTWGLDTWFQVFDWADVSEGNREVTLTMGNMPTLNEAYSWDLSRLESEGRIYVVAAVPEPGRAFLGIIALITMLFVRRKRA